MDSKTLIESYRRLIQGIDHMREFKDRYTQARTAHKEHLESLRYNNPDDLRKEALLTNEIRKISDSIKTLHIQISTGIREAKSMYMMMIKKGIKLPPFPYEATDVPPAQKHPIQKQVIKKAPLQKRPVIKKASAQKPKSSVQSKKMKVTAQKAPIKKLIQHPEHPVEIQNQPQPRLRRIRNEPFLISLPTPDDTELLYRVPWLEFESAENPFFNQQHEELLNQLEAAVMEMKSVSARLQAAEYRISEGENRLSQLKNTSAYFNVQPEIYKLKKEHSLLQNKLEILDGRRMFILFSMENMQKTFLRFVEETNNSVALNPTLNKDMLQKQRKEVLKSITETERLALAKKSQSDNLKRAQKLLRNLQDESALTDPSKLQAFVQEIAKLKSEIKIGEIHYKAIEDNLKLAMKRVNRHLQNMDQTTQELIREQNRLMFDASRIPVRTPKREVSFLNQTMRQDQESVQTRVLDLVKRRQLLLDRQMLDVEIPKEIIDADKESVKIIERELMKFCELVIFNQSRYTLALNQTVRTIYLTLSKKGYKLSRIPVRKQSKKKVIASPRKSPSQVPKKQRLTMSDYYRRMKRAARRLEELNKI